MMPYHAYQVAMAERPQSAAERRAADARLREMAAAISRLRWLTLPGGILRRVRAAKRPRPVGRRPAAA